MGMLPVYALPVFLSLGASPAPIESKHPGIPAPGGSLSAEDARYLDWLVEDFLFDPKRARYVRVLGADERMPGRIYFNGREISIDGGRDGWQAFGANGEVDGGREGWLVHGAHGEADRVYFADGESMAIADRRIRQLDFEDLCLRRYMSSGPRAKMEWERAFRQLERNDDGNLTIAAWLHRRGQDRLAAIALAAAREDRSEDPREVLRTRLARRAYDALVNAFCKRADVDALAHADRLFRLFPDEAAQFPQAEAIVGDLRRRQRAGTAARELSKDWPAGFATWNVARKVDYLIASLDEIEQWISCSRRMRFYKDLNVDRRVSALIEVGDAAIPALIDAYERDERLIRHREDTTFCGNRLRQAGPERIADVRAVLIDIIGSILRVNHWEPTGGDEKSEESPPSEVAAKLRRYWATYGQLEFDDRMMALLTDRSIRSAVRQEAAASLVAAHRRDDQTWARSGRGSAGARPSSLVTKYRSPSVAEAILAAMDEHRVQWERQKGGRGHWTGIEYHYLNSLTELGDHRAAPELARRTETARDIEGRLQLAEAAHSLGESGPMIRLSREVAAGNVWMPPAEIRDDRPREFNPESLLELLLALTHSPLPEANDALHNLAERDHPFFPLVRQLAMEPWERRYVTYLKQQPFFVTVLRSMLTDTRLTGGHYYLRGNEIEERVSNRQSHLWSPTAPYADLGLWREHVEQRVADVAMDKLDDLVVGLPEYHPLRRDAARVLAETRLLLLRYDRRMREANDVEQARLRLRQMDWAFIPDIKPLGRPATAHDVATGAAVFEQKGAGKIASLKMPAWLLLKTDASKEDPTFGLVVQAELGPDGQAIYGVIFRHAIRAVRADEVERIDPFDQEFRARGSRSLPVVILD